MTRRFLIIVGTVMVSVVVLALLFDVVGLISYGLIVLAVWLMIAIMAVWLITFILRKINLTSWSFSLGKSLKFMLLPLLAGVTGIIVMNLYAPPPILDAPTSPSEQLAYMVETDQGDRFALRFRQLAERDQQRREQVLAFYNDGAIQTPTEKYQAALILQHGTEPAHFELAYNLALEAAEGGNQDGEDLWRLAYDRWQISIGQPQKYGTQSTATFSPFGITFEQQ